MESIIILTSKNVTKLYKYFIITDKDYILLQIMNQRQTAPPLPLEQSFLFNDSLTKQLDQLSLASQACSETEVFQEGASYAKSKNIFKNSKQSMQNNRHKNDCAAKKKQVTLKKLKHLQNKIADLQRENHMLRRRCENCVNCGRENRNRCMILSDEYSINHEQLLSFVGDMEGIDSKISRDSIQFEAIDFSQSLAYKSQMDDKAWIMIGAMMITIGSKNMGVDGTINTFKLLSDCVDSVRRQVQKSASKINLQFYCIKQEMKEGMGIIEGLDFDPFFNKTQKNGFNLESVKLESAEPFDLVYDQKYTLSANYQSLIAAVQHLKQNCWILV